MSEFYSSDPDRYKTAQCSFCEKSMVPNVTGKCKDCYWVDYEPKTPVSVRNYERLAQIKLDSGCMDCGFRGHSAALDFDHVRGEKEFGIGGTYSLSWDKIQAELDKCDIVCANCHRIRTFNRKREAV